MSSAAQPPTSPGDVSLSNVKPGERLLIGELCGPEDFRRRLYQRGFLPGATVMVIRSLPFGGPLEVEIGGGWFGLRRRDARLVMGQVAPAPSPGPLRARG